MNLLTVNDVAEKLKISRWRVYQLIKAGRLPVEKFGAQFVIKPSDLKLVENRKPGRPKK